jgi:hypothetical protein
VNVLVFEVPSPLWVKIGAAGAVVGGGTVVNVPAVPGGAFADDDVVGVGFEVFAVVDEEPPPPPPAMAATMMTTMTTAPAIAHQRRHQGVADVAVEAVGVEAAGIVGVGEGGELPAEAAAGGALSVGASVEVTPASLTWSVHSDPFQYLWLCRPVGSSNQPAALPSSPIA